MFCKALFLINSIIMNVLSKQVTLVRLQDSLNPRLNLI